MKEKISIILRIILGLVFILSAYSKLIAPGIVEIIIVDHGLAPSREVAAILVRILIGLEFALGVLFFQKNYLKKVIFPAGFAFLFGFTVYLVYSGFILGDNQNCGCFGTMIEMSPVESIIKNIFLIVGLFYADKFTQKEEKKIIIPLSSLVMLIIFVFVYSPVKSASDFKFSEYTNFIDGGRTDLSEDNKLIAVYNTECEHCQEEAKEISALYMNGKDYPDFYALFFSEGEISVDSFKTITGYNFPYNEIDIQKFFELIGSEPPRIYWLKNGTVKEYWDKDFVEQIEKNFK